MPVVELTKDQIFDLVRQMPAAEKREVLHLLAGNPAARQRRQQYAEEQLRRLCAERGRDWDALNEAEREALIDELVHEDRQCGS